jgi:hypothetical protein
MREICKGLPKSLPKLINPEDGNGEVLRNFKERSTFDTVLSAEPKDLISCRSLLQETKRGV